ncbi:MAG: S8 family serine peptidase [Bacteroidota bacterium]
MYTIGFVLALFGLLGVALDRERLRAVRYLLAPGVVLWAASVFTQTSNWQALFGQSFRDLLFLGGAMLALRAIATLGKLAVPVGIVAVLCFAGIHRGIALNPSADTAATAESTMVTNYAPDAELLVELRPSTDSERWKRWIGAKGWTSCPAFHPQDGDRTDLDDYVMLDLPAGADLADVTQQLYAADLVDYVEPNEVIKLDILPKQDTPIGTSILGINDPEVKRQWAMKALKINELYELLTSDQVQPQRKALVAILDTGVDAQHEDLRANYRSVGKKYDNDPQGHGTHCAGIAGAVTNNGVGVASLARTDKFINITSVKALRAGGSGTQQDIINAIITATDKGADVLSLSLGGFSTQSRQRAYSEAVKYATDRGAIVVAAAGNSNRDAAGYTPVNATGMIGVSAIDSELQRAQFSNRVGKIAMAVAAPGVGVFSTKPNNTYAAHNGTSMATPFVSGLLGIMKSIRPDLTNKEAFKILDKTGIATKNTADTGRLIQPAAAVRALVARGADN